MYMGLLVGALAGMAVYYFAGLFIILYRKQAAFAVFSGGPGKVTARLKGIYVYLRSRVIARNAKLTEGRQRYRVISADILRLNAEKAITAPEFLAREQLCLALGFMAGLIIFENMAAALICGFAGFFLPQALLKAGLDRKTAMMRSEIPDCMDLVCAGIEGGLSLKVSLLRCAKKGRGIIHRELVNALSKTELGLSFAGALTSLKARLDFPEAAAFIDAMLRADKTGGNVKDIMRAQAEDIRKKRFQELKKKAHEAPVKLLIPLVIFIFPVIFLVLFGPVIIRLVHGF